jgi:hypothetical protein
MKLSIVAIALTFVAVVVGPNVVHADRMIRILFNNGLDDASSGSCNTADNLKIDTIVTLSGYNITYGKRNLLRSDKKNDLPDDHERELQLWPPKCKNNCAGWATRTCRATDCVGYRRQLGKAATPTNQRGLDSGKSFSCDTQKNYLDTELNKLVTNNLVSASCATWLTKPRNITCYDDVVYGVVEYFKLWKTDTNPKTLVNANYMGQDICRSTELNFEVITNECVDFLLTSLKGPNNYYKEMGEDIVPYMLFGVGNNLPHVGQYNLTALPDGIVEKAKHLTVNVVTGPVEIIKLRDTVAKTIMNHNFTGGNICRSKEFAFEIVVSSCAVSHRSTLTGPGGYSRSITEGGRPFTIFGEGDGVFYGKRLSTVGLYTLTIYPDEVITNHVKTIQFNITNC